MKIYISADIEGIGCIVRGEQSSPGGREYRWARRRMTAEVNAAVRGAFDGGAREVVVADSHNVGLNLVAEELDPRVRIVMGSPRPLSMMEGIQAGFDGVFLIGYHAMAGTPHSTIVHTYTGRIAGMTVNGQTIGEIGISAAIAGHYQIPVLLLSGDDKAVLEAEQLLQGLATVAVKQAVSSYAALCLAPKRSEELIYQAARQVVQQPGSVHPLRFGQPVEVEIRFTTASSVDKMELLPGIERVDGLTLRYRSDSVMEAFNLFHIMAALVEQVPFI